MAPPRGRRRRRAGTRLTRWLAVGAVILLAGLYYRPVKSWVETRHDLGERRAEVRALGDRNEALRERLDQIRSGATLVRGARRLGLVKPGERLFIVRGIPEWRRAHAARNR